MDVLFDYVDQSTLMDDYNIVQRYGKIYSKMYGADAPILMKEETVAEFMGDVFAGRGVDVEHMRSRDVARPDLLAVDPRR